MLSLLGALRQLLNVLLLFAFFLTIAGIVGVQLYQGVLTRRCVTDGVCTFLLVCFLSYVLSPAGDRVIGAEDSEAVCGMLDLSWASCTNQTTCTQDVGDNPNRGLIFFPLLLFSFLLIDVLFVGITSFDHFGVAVIAVMQVSTLDKWEDLYFWVCGSRKGEGGTAASDIPHILVTIFCN